MEVARTEAFYRGIVFTVEMLILDDGTMPAAQFLESFQLGDNKNYRARKRMENTIRKRADLPVSHQMHREEYKQVEQNLHAFKAWQLRLFCFYLEGNRLILLCGVLKKKDDLTPADVDRARAMRDAFLAALRRAQGTNTRRQR